MLRLLVFPVLWFGSGIWLISGAPAAWAGTSLVAAGQKPALYDTQKEAEAAALKLGCKGAHRMGDRWAPCAHHSSGGGAAHPATPH